MSFIIKNKILRLAAAGVTSLMIANAASAQEDFSGKRINMIIPYQEGSGSTIHGRLFALGLEKNLPGNPTIVIENIDGGGSVRGINQFAAVAEPDGEDIAAIATGTFFQYLLKDPAVKYDLPKFKPFLASPFGILVYSRTDVSPSDDPIETIKAMIKEPPVYGASGPTSSDLPALISVDLLGMKPQYVFGLSNAESRAGFERGEFSLNYDNMASWAQAVEPLVEDGVARPLFTLGFEKDGKIVRDPMLPDVPTFLEVYEAIHGKPLDGIEYEVWKALFNIRVMGSKMLVLPEGTSDEIYAAYADAAKAALDGDELKTEAAEAVIGPYPQRVGADANKVFQDGLNMSEEARAWLFDWLEKNHGIKR
ncbi:tripartite-type tricarboxylate transporter receptor subunit TctC [Ochrobactrum daejeonense]|uniref:Tripartite-type tricarboxylate transporter receptor subunit TctC n=1 Tax=Brucella daejeonensis TaxID=659015 RepID=A0A7W9EMQ0_9HYPH|nr:hypothetical protein [Brucella daejeonensis]MBB5703693.1 tripartite-type tricarboxylate transporter receptor subunit TctC [Brucella daejeonensis]